MYSYQQVLQLDVHKNGKIAVTEAPDFYSILMNAALPVMLCIIFSKQRALIICNFSEEGTVLTESNNIGNFRERNMKEFAVLVGLKCLSSRFYPR
jgi:hypothetical protein